MTTKQAIMDTAKRRSHGGFVDTDGRWCLTTNAEEFKAFLEDTFGFTVVDCRPADGSTAIAITIEGYRIAWNGHCSCAPT